MKSYIKKIKVIVDVFMVVLMPQLMLYSLIGEELHEWYGTIMLFLFLIHHLLNWRWYKNILQGKYNLQRIVWTIINSAISICMILTGLSGIMMSNHVFPLDILNGGISLARKLHLVYSHWLFVLTSVHAGMHLNVMKGYINLRTNCGSSTVIKKSIFLAKISIAIYGVRCFVITNMLDYMLYHNQFMFLDFSKPVFLTYLNYFSILILFVMFGARLQRVIRRK